MFYASSHSSLFKEYTAYFILLCGFVLTYMTALFNLNSTASVKYNWFFVEPFVYLALVYVDSTGLIDSNMAMKLYIAFFAYIMLVYLALMRNIVI